MKYAKLENYVSQPRLNRFFIAGGNSKHKAEQLYRANLSVCQAFYPVLNLFEVFLRNTCNDRIASRFQDSDWINTEITGFMSHRSLNPSNYFLKNSVVNAQQRILRKGDTVTAGKVLAEQTLGFWTSLFETHHYKLIGGVVIQCFNCKPAAVNRSHLSQKLTRIREFRNRIYHNEPVCFAGTTIDFAIASSIRNEIYELLAWMDPDLPGYVGSYDNVTDKISRAKLI